MCDDGGGDRCSNNSDGDGGGGADGADGDDGGGGGYDGDDDDGDVMGIGGRKQVYTGNGAEWEQDNWFGYRPAGRWW